MGYGIWYLNVISNRQAALAAFCKSNGEKGELSPLTGDASSRRYYRINGKIAVDAPPKNQKNLEFINIDRALMQNGLNVPKIFAYDLEQGFMLIEDLGCLSFDKFNTPKLKLDAYEKACDELGLIASTKILGLPLFDNDFIDLELDIFREWLLDKTLNLSLSLSEKEILNRSFTYIKQVCLSQEQISMHRDFHCRNLMVKDDKIFIIDFQDMVKGPITYDLASLLFDCYVKLPPEFIEILSFKTYSLYKNQGFLRNKTYHDFLYDLNIASLQRHLKVLGIFRRLYMRDGKDRYLNDLPRVLNYTICEGEKVPILEPFVKFLKERIPKDKLCAR